ncbi:hypothetical protein PVK06_017798 [Gossypium arboreum]|uniref:DUF4219 domain-containing protein n=1 Tax=Gossypium arboreum TaxID=29729 RepID=A0ABR0Q4G9_GOSAR|nr:hypothetical protein PVK06_017798 [Gossypium arboreum]
MESGSSNMSALAPPVFDGENYQTWAVRMQAYMESCDYWEVFEEDYEVTLVLNNPTMNMIKMHKERNTGKAKMELHARKQMKATLEATLVEKEFIEGEY